MNFEKFFHQIFINYYLCSHVCSQCHQSSSAAFSEWLPKQWWVSWCHFWQHVSWYHDIMVSWYHFTMVTWYNVTIVSAPGIYLYLNQPAEITLSCQTGGSLTYPQHTFGSLACLEWMGLYWSQCSAVLYISVKCSVVLVLCRHLPGTWGLICQWGNSWRPRTEEENILSSYNVL